MAEYFPHADFSLVSQVESSLSRHGAARRRVLQGLTASIALPGLVACGGDGSVGESGGGSSAADTQAWRMISISHPGLLHTEVDFARMRSKLEARAQPWVAGWDQLSSGDYTNLNRTPNPLVTVIRGQGVTAIDANGNVFGQNFGTMVFDMESAYQIALRWKISGDPAYGDLAVRFLNAWSSTMASLIGNADRFIAAGLYGYQWANAAEIMRGYSGWASADVARFQKWLLDVWYPLCHDFLTNHNGADITNYWASWDLLSLCGVYAIGVFCDRVDICHEALDYYASSGRGNGAAAHAVYVVHPGYLGQWQESGRDQGHSTLGISCLASLCEMAWNQGVDLYGDRNNRFLAAAEYVAKSNLLDGSGNFYALPYSIYTNKQGTMTSVSSAGRVHSRPCWESIYNHYVNRKGLSAPWVSAMAAKLRPEGRDTGGDEPGFGTLAYSRDAFVGDIAPSGLTAVLHAGKVQLSWWGCAYASSYRVKRASSANGPFSTIATVADPRTYSDMPPNAVWYYAVTGFTPSGETAISNVVRVILPNEARTILSLDGNVNDQSGLSHHGELSAGATWGTGRGEGRKALLLDGLGAYASLPEGILADIGDFTVSVWVYWEGGPANQRIFDFGSSDITYLALMLESSRVRFAATGTHYWGERCIYHYAALPVRQWVHVALTLSGESGTLYLNGVAVATDNALQFAPFQMGNTRRNWLGRSQYSADPYFKGRLQDFRLYNGALSAAQIAALAI